jgi:hypothetical protein
MNYAPIDAVHEGTRLRADGGFTCIWEHALLTVQRASEGYLYVPCGHGKHALDGQIEGREYIGLELVD